MVLILKNALPSTKNTHYHHVPLSTTTEDPSDESSFDSDDPSENQILLHKRKTRSLNPNGNPSFPFFYTKLLLQTAYQRSFQKTAKNVTLQFFFQNVIPTLITPILLKIQKLYNHLNYHHHLILVRCQSKY